VHGIHEEDGETFLAMAFIDGPSLAEKIKQRPLRLEEALDIAVQIGEGLKEAHEKGLVHRDIKPQNIMLTAKGQVKIMDFGLASLAGRSKLTKSGTTLGTPAYMSPEQLQAKQADQRTDIWALGCVMYEMLTQRTPFAAEYQQAIAYGILNEDPEPISAQRTDVRPEIDHLIAKTLAKDPDERYQHVDDLLTDLRVLQKQNAAAKKSSVIGRALPGMAPAAQATPVQPVPPRGRTPWVERSLIALVAAALGVGAVLMRTPQPAASAISATISAPFGVDEVIDLALSPDSRQLVLVGQTGAETSLWLRPLDETAARRLPGTEGARYPFWSPNSASIGFVTASQLTRMEPDGHRIAFGELME
jgi:serine/threonine-protein kinase